MRFLPVAPPECIAAVLLVAGWLSPADSPARAAGPSPAETARQQPIVIDAAHSYVDYKSNTVTFRDVSVAQGDTRVTAERAHAAGVGFTNSEWTFEGKVLMTLRPRGTLRADQAIVQFRDNRIATATATGKPALFEERHTDSRRPAHGHADRIVYTAKDDSIRLSGDAWLADSRDVEISGPVLVYDIRNERLEAASPDARRRVHITVTPGTLRKKGQAPPGKARRR